MSEKLTRVIFLHICRDFTFGGPYNRGNFFCENKGKFMARPKGSKDKTKRRSRRLTSHLEEIAIIKDYNASLLTNKQICEKHNISIGGLRGIKIRRNVPPKNIDDIIGKALEHKDLKEKCGIYAITNRLSGEDGARRAYIGSSVDIYTRIENHLCLLKKGEHYNKSLQGSWSEDNYCLFVIEECKEEELLDREIDIINKINPGVLHNTHSGGSDPPERQYMTKIKQHILKHVVIDENGCWVSTKNIKKGYCEISYSTFSRNGIRKVRYIKAHRFMYYDATGDWARLVRHMCDNSLCCNPEHLEAGSCRQNNLDRFKEKRRG